MSVNERIKMVADHFEKGNKRQFAIAIGISAPTVGAVINDTGKPGYDFLLAIANTYSEISMDWVITGKGEMLNTNGVNEEQAPYGKIDYKKEFTECAAKVYLLEKEIAVLKGEENKRESA